VTTNPISGLIPRGSLGLKLLLVCVLVLAMGVPLLVVGGLVAERENRARQVTAQIGGAAGGSQVIGGPMLLVPYSRTVEVTDDQNRVQRRIDRGSYVIFPSGLGQYQSRSHQPPARHLSRRHLHRHDRFRRALRAG
jgi:inner membrane protein involved in colicin E2 resistance